MTPPTGQPSDADLARWAVQHAKLREHNWCGCGDGTCAYGPLLAAVRDRDARIAAVRALCDDYELIDGEQIIAALDGPL